VVSITTVSSDAPDVRDLLATHLALMQAQTPAESCHALPSDALKSDDIILLGLYDGDSLLGVGALKRTGREGEIKSMHVRAEARGRGVGRMILDALLARARERGLDCVNLETGSGPEHAAARALYARAGFAGRGPFGPYRDDPLSHFMTLPL
jgi:putative acetyltransferase